MPIKLAKGFVRRKSSGNILEEVENRPQSSFRVMERPPVDGRSVSEGNLLSPKVGKVLLARRSSQPLEDPDNLYGSQNPQFQDRGGTDSSATTSGTHNSSLQRFSSSSAGRASNEVQTRENTQSSYSKGFHDIPPLTGALRAAGRTLSFGGRFYSKPSPPTPQPAPSNQQTNKAMATTTPPKLDTDLGFGKNDDFQDMLDGFGSPERKTHELSPVDKPAASPSTSAAKTEKSRPAPINTDRSKQVEPSPYSWDSRHSEEGLLDNEKNMNEGRKSVPPTTSHRALERPRTNSADKGLRRSAVFFRKRTSGGMEDEDARLITQSLYSKKSGSHLPLAADDEAEEEQPLFGYANARGPSPLQSRKSPTSVEFHPDSSIADSAHLAAQYEHTLPSPTSPANKVMTPSQFEHYRKQQELRISNSDASKSEYSEEGDFDEDDEAEKNREAEMQRRKQEAQLSVYRQQMMKVTGQQPSTTSLRRELNQACSSTPNLTAQSTHPGNRSRSGKSIDGDEDEEIPLGILAAHGFPNKTRSPAVLSSSRSNPNIRASFQPPMLSSASACGDHEAVSRDNLPAFARNLPRDPYYGASLVNPTNRESLALGGGAASVHGNPPSPALPPGGLVGVIATEERARAIRRGSPNVQAAHEHAGVMGIPGGVPHPTSGIPRPYSMSPQPPSVPSPQPQVSATEQAQIQLSQQMSQMMQVQMQWMQQMMHMQGAQNSLQPPPQMPLNSLSMPDNPNARHASLPVFNNAPVRPQGDRALSMMDPNVSSQLNVPPMPYGAAAGIRPGTPSGQGYAASIAPSERSYSGAVPRYRPMSTVPVDHVPSPLAQRPWNDENQKPSISLVKPPTPSMAVRPISSSGMPAISKPRKTAVVDDDEDEDEGWAEMVKRRKNKKSNWKTKREAPNMGELLNAVQ